MNFEGALKTAELELHHEDVNGFVCVVFRKDGPAHTINFATDWQILLAEKLTQKLAEAAVFKKEPIPAIMGKRN